MNEQDPLPLAGPDCPATFGDRCLTTDHPNHQPSTAPNFEGVAGSSCEHRTVGPHRAWCHTCGEWRYPSDPCVRCKPFVPVDWPARFGAAADAAERAREEWIAHTFRDLERVFADWSTTPDVVEAIGRALLGETTDARLTPGPDACTARIYPAWANRWVRCGSVVRNGRCVLYGHRALLGETTESGPPLT